MPKITIIGSDSYIATHFYNAIKGEYIIDLFSRVASQKENEQIQPDLFELNKNNFLDSDIVINFAAIVHRPEIKNPEIYKNINTTLPLHLAKESKKAGVKHYIQMSTIAVYGNVNFINELTPEFPETLYGISKLNADKKLLKMANQDFIVSIIRPPMVYGGKKVPGNMMRLIKLVRKKIPLPFSNIKNERAFIHIYNLVQALELCVKYEIEGKIIPCDENTASTPQLVSLIASELGQRVMLFKLPYFVTKFIKLIKTEVYSKLFGSLKVEISQNLLDNGYKPKYDIQEGIKEMIKLNK